MESADLKMKKKHSKGQRMVLKRNKKNFMKLRLIGTSFSFFSSFFKQDLVIPPGLHG